jgi:hypothetical protein
MWRVKDWNSHFEKAQSRSYDRISWVSVPNKHDGDGYTQLIEHDHGASHYGAWIALVQVASKCTPRGVLIRESGKPHDAESLARQTRIGAHLFREAIPRFITIGWLENIDDTTLSADYQHGITNVTKRNVTEPNVTKPVRSFRAADQIDVWEAARQRAKEIKRVLWPSRKTPLSERDRDMVLKVAYLSIATLSESWLADGVEGTRLKRDARKPSAYLKTILASSARRIGHDLNELLESVTIPPKPNGKPPAELATNIGTMPGANE